MSGADRIGGRGPGGGRSLAAAAAVLVVLTGLAAVWLGTARPGIGPIARRSVAVLAVTSRGAAPTDATWLATALPELLTEEVAAGGALRAISGERVAQVKHDLGVPPGALDAALVARLAAAVGADVVVLGTYEATGGETLALELDVVDGAGRRTGTTVTERGTHGDLYALTARAGAQLRRALGVAASSAGESARPHGVPGSAVEATRLHALGLERLRAFDPLAARNLFQQAAAADPSSPVAHSGLSRAWASLGFHSRAREHAERAFRLSSSWPPADRLLVEARHHEAARAWDAAIEAWRRLVAAYPDEMEHALGLGSALTGAGRPREALPVIERLQRQAPHDARVDLAESRAAQVAGDLVRGRTAAERATTKAGGARLLLADAHLECATAYRAEGDLARALASAADARRLYSAAGHIGGVARALGVMASTAWYRGDYGAAHEFATQSLGHCREIGDLGCAAWALNTLAGLLTDEGRLAEARRHYEQTLAIASELGDKDREAIAANNIGIALWKQGDLDRAERALTESLSLARAVGSERRAAFALYHLAEVLRERGRLTEARQHFEQALSVARSAGLPSTEADCVAGLARLAHAAGDLAEARRGLEEAASVKRQRGETGYEARTMLALALVALDAEAFEDAEREAREAIRAFEAERAHHLEALALTVLARSMGATARSAEARAAAERAESLVAGSEYTALRLEVELAAGRVRAKVDPRQSQRQRFERVRSEAERSGFRRLELDARLALAEADRLSGSASAETFRALAADAAEAGYGLLARTASASFVAQ